jgi:hypothetical protein
LSTDEALVTRSAGVLPVSRPIYPLGKEIEITCVDGFLNNSPLCFRMSVCLSNLDKKICYLKFCCGSGLKDLVDPDGAKILDTDPHSTTLHTDRKGPL